MIFIDCFKKTPVFALGVVIGLCTTPAYAVHDYGVFELDGDALDGDGNVLNFPDLPDDWQTLYSDTGHATTTTDPKSDGGNVVVEDPAPGSIFTGGGSKDEADVSNPNNANDPHVWAHKSGSVPDKDDITNAYAANYIVPSGPHAGEQVIYFGADRLSNDGDALMGFWFFQNEITANPDGTFSGVHENEDVLVIASFVGGGDIAIEQVLEWDDTCLKADKNPQNAPLTAGQCGGTNLRIKVAEGTATCGLSADDDTCAIANSGDETSPWPYTPKSGTAGTFPDASFFEGGLNIPALFGSNKCFSSFVAETRSSSSVDAVLKDFVLGGFAVCAIDSTKTCVNDSTADDALNAIKYNIRGCAINDGSGDINITSLLNSIGGGTATTPSDLKWYLPGQVSDPLRDFDPATDCGNATLLKQAVTSGTEVTSSLSTTDLAAGEALVYQFSETTTNQATDTVTIDAEGTDGSAIDNDTASATCPVRIFNAALSVTKDCNADLEDAGSTVVVKIDVSGQVCNQGEVQLTNVSLTDNPAFYPGSVSLGSTTLAPKGQTGECTGYTAYYYPSSIPSGDICPFSDSVTATATAPGGSSGANCTGSPLVCTSPANTATCNLRAVDDDNDCSTGPLGN